MTDLLTSSYATYDGTVGVAVSISVGRPKFPIRYAVAAHIDALKPRGLLWRQLPWPDFADAYRAQLERVGTSRLREDFDGLMSTLGGSLVLLCFERPGQPCHRHVFAEWWQQQTDEAVAEFQPTTAQLALDLTSLGAQTKLAQNDHIVPSGHLRPRGSAR